MRFQWMKPTPAVPGVEGVAGVLGVRAVGEREPLVVDAAGVVAGVVVPDGVVANAISDEVEIDLDPAGVSGVDEGEELGLGAEAGIDLAGVAVLIAVIGGGGEDGVHPHRGHAEGLEVVEAGGHAVEIAEAVLVVVAVAPN